MKIFQFILISIFVVVVLYTRQVIQQHGWGLFDIFFGDMAAMTWPGQFNLDFLCFLIFSALWTAWRNQFSWFGVLLGLAMLVGGSPLLCVYLLYLSFQENSSIPEILIGRRH